MSKFKVGDKVRITEGGYGCGDEKVGLTGRIVEMPDAWSRNFTILLDNGEILDSMWKEGFELVADGSLEQTKKWLQENPWFIRVNNEQEFDLIQEWLLENYGSKLSSSFHRAEWLTNTTSEGHVCKYNVMWGTGYPLKAGRQEIFPQFKLTLEDVILPAVETEVQKQVRELQDTIEKASKQLQDLQKEVK